MKKMIKFNAQYIVICLCLFMGMVHANDDNAVSMAQANKFLAQKEYQKAFEAFNNIQDIPMAKLSIALFYKLGWGDIAQDNGQACKWFEKAATESVPLAYKELGDCIVHFQYTMDLTEHNDPQHNKPDYWYQMAFESGIHHAACELGKLHLDSQWFTENVPYAIELCTMSAQRSAVDAQLTLGHIYSTYETVYDIELAEFWLNNALKAGSGEAAYKLAKLYQLAANHVEEKQPYLDKAMVFMEKSASLKFVPAYEETAVLFWLKLSDSDKSESSLLAKSYIWLKTAINVAPTEQNQELFLRVKQHVPAAWLKELDQKVDDFLSTSI